MMLNNIDSEIITDFSIYQCLDTIKRKKRKILRD